MLADSEEAKSEVKTMLKVCASSQKLYGRDAESLANATSVMLRVLGKYRPDQVLRAFEIWMERSSEFPTPADIAGLIRRGGKPPLDKAVYVTLSKKDPEFLTDEEWEYKRDYEAEQMTGDMEPDDRKYEAMLDDQQRLRNRIGELEREVSKLTGLLREARAAKALPVADIPLPKRVQNTVDHMRQTGASQEDVETFIASMTGQYVPNGNSHVGHAVEGAITPTAHG